MKVCAYCGHKRKLTREHILPKFTIDMNPQVAGLSPLVGWNDRAENFIRGESVIADVCAQCNNGPLSKLDSYGEIFLSKANVAVPVCRATSIILHYEYDLLLRWLLKISFNSARAFAPSRHSYNLTVARLGLSQPESQTNLFEPLKQYILEGENSPSTNEVCCMVELLRPSKIPEHLKNQLPGDFPISDDGLANPFICRVGRGYTYNQGISVRSVSFGALVFTLVFDNGIGTHSEIPKFARQQIKLVRNRIVLRRNRKAVVLKSSDRDWLDHGLGSHLRAESVKAFPSLSVK